MDAPEVIMLLGALLGSFFVSLKIYKASARSGDLSEILIAAACFIGTFILIYFVAFIAWIIFGDGFSRR